MNRDRYVTSDMRFDDFEARQLVEQFQTVINELNSALANALPRSRVVVSILRDQAREKEAEAIAKEVQKILDHTQKLSQTFDLLKEILFHTAAGSGGRSAA